MNAKFLVLLVFGLSFSAVKAKEEQKSKGFVLPFSHFASEIWNLVRQLPVSRGVEIRDLDYTKDVPQWQSKGVLLDKIITFENKIPQAEIQNIVENIALFDVLEKALYSSIENKKFEISRIIIKEIYRKGKMLLKVKKGAETFYPVTDDDFIFLSNNAMRKIVDCPDLKTAKLLLENGMKPEQAGFMSYELISCMRNGGADILMLPPFREVMLQNKRKIIEEVSENEKARVEIIYSHLGNN